MDKNTLIGLLLIFALFLGYSLYLSPSKAEREEQQRRYDSAMAAQQMVRDSLALLSEHPSQSEETMEAEQGIPSDSTLTYRQKFSRFAVFTHAAETPEQLDVTQVENELYRFDFTPKGGRICRVELKEVYTYDSLPVVLFDDRTSQGNAFGFDFVSNYITLNTGDFYFVPMQAAGNYSVKGNDSLQIGYQIGRASCRERV